MAASCLLRAVEVLAEGSWSGETLDAVSLTYDERHRRRIRLMGRAGTDFLLDLPRAALLAEGDGLLLADGGIIRVEAAPEALMEVRAGRASELVRLAWHIGNRHLPAELRPDSIRLREDHVISAMLEGLGAEVERIEAPFSPEAGAYSGGGHHHHGGHGHDDDAGPGPRKVAGHAV